MKKSTLKPAVALIAFLLGVFGTVFWSADFFSYRDSKGEEMFQAPLVEKENEEGKIIVPEANRTKPLGAFTAHQGCWAGSKGGRLKITADKIHDLGSKETALYHIIYDESDSKNFLLKTDGKVFKRSFLNTYVRITFKTDDLIFIYTYESYEDYVNDKFYGAGTFEKNDCRKLQSSN
jgi:hypothetical protein